VTPARFWPIRAGASTRPTLWVLINPGKGRPAIHILVSVAAAAHSQRTLEHASSVRRAPRIAPSDRESDHSDVGAWIQSAYSSQFEAQRLASSCDDQATIIVTFHRTGTPKIVELRRFEPPDLLHAMQPGFRLTASRWVRSPQIRAALMSGTSGSVRRESGSLGLGLVLVCPGISSEEVHLEIPIRSLTWLATGAW